MLMYWKIVIYKRELLDIQVPIFLSKSKEKKNVDQFIFI